MVGARPMVSIVMPVRDEAASIEPCMERVLEQDYPPGSTEVIVADGRSTDDTVAIVRRIAERSQRDGGPKIVVIDNPKQIIPAALNACLREARGDVIVRVDGHCEIQRDHVSRCVDALRTTGADNVGGLMDAVGEGLVGRAVAAATSSPFGVGNARFHYATEPGWVDTVFLGAYPRAVFERIGMYDEEMVKNEDDELNFRLTQAGGRIWLDPAIVTRYRPRESFGALWRQYYSYGFYKVLVMRKRRGVASWRHLVPAAFVIGGATSIAATVVTGLWLFAAGYFGVYLLASTAASVLQRGRLGPTRILLPVVFFALHTAYGVGTLLGIMRWVRPSSASG